ncbi:MAG: EboA domain-containing protein [Planctomycetes bacterium]|nr:EboA domain-containing protein [Planctomycetota bacterium]
MNTQVLLRELAARRWSAEARAWFERAAAESARGVDDERFCVLFSEASRWVRPKVALAPSDAERARARSLMPGFDPERWTALEATRAALLFAHQDLDRDAGARATDELFRYADVGEHSALLKSLPHLPAPERFLARAREGARSNMRSAFEAIACDSPYAARFFDAVGWRQLAIKALFIEAPLWRVFGFDERVDPELARMALDLADERRSAGRPVNPETWMCLGKFAGARGLQSLEHEFARGTSRGRAAAALGFARAGELDRLRSLVAVEKDELVRDTLSGALAGRSDSSAFQLAGAAVQGAR